MIGIIRKNKCLGINNIYSMSYNLKICNYNVIINYNFYQSAVKCYTYF